MRQYIRSTYFYLLRSYRFISIDLWRINPNERHGWRGLLFNTIKVISLSIKSFIDDKLIRQASSLTYSTILSIVPVLAIIVGIAKGFGLQYLVRESLLNAFPGQGKQLELIFTYVENYLGRVQGGLFIGLGLLILLYTVLMLIITVEDTFNEIWQAPHPRAWSRRIIDYLGLFILIPIFIVTSSGLTIFLTTLKNTYLQDIVLLDTMSRTILRTLPFILYTGGFTALYMFLPNIKVRLIPALISGAVAGIAFQGFQSLYISGVLWISTYNAVYGSFAAFPLLLLWTQLSWAIILFGAQLSYSIQNLRSFAFENASTKVSRRYIDFVALIITHRIILRFSNLNTNPYNADSLSDECHIPPRLTRRVLRLLTDLGILTEISHGNDLTEVYYQPAIDTDLITTEYILKQIDRYGTEDFRIDKELSFATEWELIQQSRSLGFQSLKDSKLKSL